MVPANWFAPNFLHNTPIFINTNAATHMQLQLELTLTVQSVV
jgi:hypothetical protein